ncbi:MAG: hypothetical protein IPH10_07320 [bacterium]|nr:hypothetical protein [bacterium]
MALFGASIEVLTNNLLATVVQIVEEAQKKEKVYLISPYLQLNTNVCDVINKAIAEGVEVRLIYRAGYELRQEDRKYLATAHVGLKTLGHLHAKLYVSELTALVTSLNLYNYSDKESRELGIRFTDSKTVQVLKEQAESWWEMADKVDKAELLSQEKATATKSLFSGAKTQGHCIRCGAPKSFNPKYPLCDTCYPIWSKFKDETYEEKYCHKCGNKNPTSVKSPLCRPCWSATR